MGYWGDFLLGEGEDFSNYVNVKIQRVADSIYRGTKYALSYDELDILRKIVYESTKAIVECRDYKTSLENNLLDERLKYEFEKEAIVIVSKIYDEKNTAVLKRFACRLRAVSKQIEVGLERVISTTLWILGSNTSLTGADKIKHDKLFFLDYMIEDLEGRDSMEIFQQSEANLSQQRRCEK